MSDEWKPMPAGDVRCPTCSTPLRDVAQDYDLNPKTRWQSGQMAMGSWEMVSAHCENGHALVMHWDAETGLTIGPEPNTSVR